MSSAEPIDATELLLSQHRRLEALLRDLLDADDADARRNRLRAVADELTLHVLAEQAVHHHGEEEEHLFPTAHLLLDAAHREAVGRDMLRLQGEMRVAGSPRNALLGSTDAAAELLP